MRIAVSLLAGLAVVVLTGCAGPENKFGRGMNNLTEIIRGGEMRRSFEQTALWDGPNNGPTAFARGFTRSMTRTGVGIYEVVTFPFPSYDPLLTPKSRLYPDYSVRTRKYPWGGLELPEQPGFQESYIPGLPAGSIFETDTGLGFSGGEVAPWFPGNKFKPID